MSANPLLNDFTAPNHAPPFEDIKDAHYLPAVETAITEARRHIEEIKNNPSAPDFENTIVALETAAERLGNVLSIFYNALSSIGGDALHELAEKIGPLSSAYSSDVIMDETLFSRVKIVHEKGFDSLNPEQQTLLKETYKDFVRGGALLPEEKKQRMREIAQEFSILAPSFMNNVKKSAENFELILSEEKDLSGLPESAVEAARHAAAEKGYDGKYLITLDYPSYGPFLQFADHRVLREKLWRAYAGKAYGDEFDNCKNILKIVNLRHEKAQILGYRSHAHYVLEERMAQTPETVMAFLDKMQRAYKPAALLDLKMLQDFADVDDLKPWDVAYYGEKLKQKLFDFSSEDFRPYFQLDRVLEGCFGHFEKLFGLRFEEAGGKYPRWHTDVKVFELFDAKTGAFIGTLYGDFHPRSGKKDGAWKTAYRSQGLFQGKIERPVIAIVCNFTKPTAKSPSLLTHGEVTTLFHEMGHAVHALLSDVTYRSLAGTNVLWDFVELPSQVQENWCYEKETLDSFAQHYKTGEKIPAVLIEKLRKAKNFMGGWAGLRQICLGTLDMAWHNGDPARIQDVAAFEDQTLENLSLFPRYGGPISASFSHIFAGGYAAGYYSYKWAEVLDSDTFELFLERGLYDSETAAKYRTEILAKGGSIHPRVLYRNFRGRDPDPDALLRKEGLLSA